MSLNRKNIFSKVDAGQKACESTSDVPSKLSDMKSLEFSGLTYFQIGIFEELGRDLQTWLHGYQYEEIIFENIRRNVCSKKSVFFRRVSKKSKCCTRSIIFLMAINQWLSAVIIIAFAVKIE